MFKANSARESLDIVVLVDIYLYLLLRFSGSLQKDIFIFLIDMLPWQGVSEEGIIEQS